MFSCIHAIRRSFVETATLASSMLSISSLDSSASECDVQAVLDISNKIFEIDVHRVPQEPPASIEEWLHRLRNADGEIVYAVDDTGRTVAFVFVFQRDPADRAQRHIWIAGCREDCRQKGAMREVFEYTEKKYLQMGVTCLTVNTYPSRFVNMPKFLASRGFQCYERAPPSAEHLEMGEKWLYRKYLLAETIADI